MHILVVEVCKKSSQGPSLKLHKALVGDILYYTTSHVVESTKKKTNKQVHVNMLD
jgi:hypothetical protein